MKKPLKAKNVVTKKARPDTSKAKPKLVSFKLAEHKHTGRLIHHRHTSHIALVGILLFTGLFIYLNKSEVLAQESSSVSIGVVVPSQAPMVGAVITSPKNGDIVNGNGIIYVKGTCPAGNFIVIKSNGLTVGSTICKESGSFSLKVQLLGGANILSALNYDNLNQSGPITPTVSITANKKSSSYMSVSSIVPSNPSVISGMNLTITDCKDYKDVKLPIGGEPRIAVICVPRFFGPNIEQVLGIIVWGGEPPYAVTIDWGDGSDESLISLKSQGYRKEAFSYKNAGNFNITFKLKDNSGNTAIVQTAVQVNGETPSVTSPISALTNELFNTSWLKTPVPMYVLAVAVTLGFWGGDIFDRYFGAKKPHHKHRKIAHS